MTKKKQSPDYLSRWGWGVMSGESSLEASLAICHRYLNETSGKSSWKAKREDKAFWAPEGGVADRLTPAVYGDECFGFVLTRYFQQEEVQVPIELLLRFAAAAPETVAQSIRRSGVFLKENHPRWEDCVLLAKAMSTQYGPLIEVGDRLRAEWARLKAARRFAEAKLRELDPLQILTYVSLYVFKELLPTLEDHSRTEGLFNVLDDLWRKSMSPLGSRQESDLSLLLVRERYEALVADWLRPSGPSKDAAARFETFEQAVDAALAVYRFEQSVLASFQYDGNFEIRDKGEDLYLCATNDRAHALWVRDGQKREIFEAYAMVEAAQHLGPLGEALANRDPNLEALQTAWAASFLLYSVYGYGKEIRTGDIDLPILQTVNSLTSYAKHIEIEYIEPYRRFCSEGLGWLDALRALQLYSASQEKGLRFPLRMDARRDLESAFSSAFPDLDPVLADDIASRITDFWAVGLESDGGGRSPTLSEAPLIRYDDNVFVVAGLLPATNRCTGLVNNLRRWKKAGRGDTEAHEARLGEYFRRSGFKTVINYKRHEHDGAIEIDLIAARDGELFVIELKSTFTRSTLKSVFAYEVSTLRKAGRQLNRSLPVLLQELEQNKELRMELGLECVPDESRVHAWIVDTTFECDHRRYSGFLKISLQELYIALSNDYGQLRLAQVLALHPDARFDIERDPKIVDRLLAEDLYPDGFSASAFGKAVESELVWWRLMIPVVRKADLEYSLPIA